MLRSWRHTISGSHVEGGRENPEGIRGSPLSPPPRRRAGREVRGGHTLLHILGGRVQHTAWGPTPRGDGGFDSEGKTLTQSTVRETL